MGPVLLASLTQDNLILAGKNLQNYTHQRRCLKPQEVAGEPRKAVGVVHCQGGQEENFVAEQLLLPYTADSIVHI